MSKFMRKLWRIFTTLLLALTVLLAVALCGVRLAGLTPYAVLSGSMEPVYPVGSVIYIKSVPPEEIAVGDPITFVMNEALVVATHRVVRIDRENSLFFTKGDANLAADGAPVHFQNLLGRPVFALPYLGYFSSWISRPPGMYLGLSAGAILLLLLFLPELLRKADAADKKAAEREAASNAARKPM